MIPFFMLLGIALVFIILAVVFLCGKGSFLIAGYNTASAAERAKYDEKALCKAMGLFMIALAVCWLIAALGILLEIAIVQWVGMALFCIVIVIGLISINTSKKIKRK